MKHSVRLVFGKWALALFRAATSAGIEWTISLQALRTLSSRLHAEISSSISCRLFFMVFCCISDFRMLNGLSIGFLPGLLPSHGSLSMPWTSRNSVTERPLWQGAPSCMKMRFPVPEKPRLLAHSFSWGINRFSGIVLYCFSFICPSTMRKRPVPNTLMTLRTMTCVGWFTLWTTQSCRRLSPDMRRTYCTRWSCSGLCPRR